jgi:hypothetical protein
MELHAEGPKADASPPCTHIDKSGRVWGVETRGVRRVGMSTTWIGNAIPWSCELCARTPRVLLRWPAAGRSDEYGHGAANRVVPGLYGPEVRELAALRVARLDLLKRRVEVAESVTASTACSPGAHRRAIRGGG